MARQLKTGKAHRNGELYGGNPPQLPRPRALHIRCMQGALEGEGLGTRPGDGDN